MSSRAVEKHGRERHARQRSRFPVDWRVLVLWACAAQALSPASAYTQGNEDPGVELPKAFGVPRSVVVAPALGAVSESIPIVVPPGRRNVEPRLSLTYSSMAGLGDAGLGWQLDIGQVERWRGDGTPAVRDADTFSYSLGGSGGQLVDTGEGVYRSRLESLYREFRRSGEHWETFNGEGALHRFGGTPEARISGRLWLLDLVRDPHGNTITYAYCRGMECMDPTQPDPDGALYPQEIRYTGFEPSGDPGANRVLFEYQPNRPDVRFSYGRSLREEKRLRLSRISVFAGEDLARRYELAYEQSPLNGHSLLTSITLVGSDDESRIAVRTFVYRTRALGWSGDLLTNSIPSSLADQDGKETGARVLDVNGDGFADVVGNGQHVYLGDGQGGFAWNASWSASLAAAGVQFVEPAGDYAGADKGVRLVDVDSDGLPDLFIATPFWGGRTEVRLNTGMGWSYNPPWTTSLQALSDIPCGFGNPNFDPGENCSLPYCADYPTLPLDRCLPPPCQGTEADPDPCSPPRCQGAEDDPDPCTPPTCDIDPAYDVEVVEPFALVDSGYDSKGVQLTDVNGDGRVDILWSMSRKQLFWWGRTPVNIRAVFLNDGSGWQKNDLLTASLRTLPDFVTDSQLQGYDVMDVNGDGLADIVGTLKKDQEVRSVLLGTGSGWIRDASFSASLVENDLFSLNQARESQGLMPTDFDDDGLVDYLQANDSSQRAYRNTGTGWQLSPATSGILAVLGVRFSTLGDETTVSTGTVLADVDGDGLSDLLKAKEGATTELRLSANLRDGLLETTTSALGEVTEIEYAISTSFDNQHGGIESLPTPMLVVTGIRRHDGRGNVYETTYDYGGGLFEDRQFRGFRWNRQSLPTGFQTETWFHQVEGVVGQPELETGFDSEGRLRTRRSSLYARVPTLPSNCQLDANCLVTQIRLEQSDLETIDPEGARHSRMMNTYDERLNYVSVFRDPEVEVDGDETTTSFSWARNEEAGIWSLPARTSIVHDPAGSVLSEFILLYDNLPEGEVLLGLPSTRMSLVAPRESGETGTYLSKSMDYDPHGNVIAIEDADGNTSAFGYDEPTATFRTRAIDPEGRELRSAYDPRFGALLQDVDAAGNLTFRSYDAFGRLVRVTLPGDEDSPFGTRSYTCSSLGDAGAQSCRVAATETPGEAGTLDTTRFFDGMGRVYRVEKEGPAGRPIILRTEYDDADNPVATSRPFFEGDGEFISEITRDELHRPTRIQEPDGTAITLSYAGPRADVVDRRGSMSSFYNDADGNMTAIHQWVDGVEQVTRYVYDPLGRLTTVIDAAGEETHIAYDALGRRVHLEDSNAGTYAYGYDGSDNLVAQTGPDATEFRYDRAGKLLEKRFSDNRASRFRYDAAGRIVRVEDASGTVDLAYDVRGNVVERRRKLGERTYVTGYSYDSLGRIRRITYPDGYTANHAYDAAGNLTRVTDGQGRLVAELTAYNAAGQPGEMSFGNGVRSGLAYDELLRMTSIQTASSEGETLQDSDYAYDPDGNVLSITDFAFGASESFGYDAVGRLIRAQGPYGEERYEYDAIGNLMRKGNLVFAFDPEHPQRATCVVDLGAGPGNANGIGNNPHTSLCDEPRGGNSFRLTYDVRGNVIAKGGTRYEYGAENELVRVRDAQGKLIEANVYDAAGQRVIEATRDGTTTFVDGIYEESKTHASRHVWAGRLLVSTLVTPRATVRLITQAPPAMLGGGGRTMIPRTLAGIALVGLVILLRLALVSLRSMPWRRWGAGIADAGRAAQRRPATAGVSLLLTLAIVNASFPAVAAAASANLSAAQPRSEQHYYYHSNHLGSTHVVTDGRGKIVERRNYKPYGDPFEWTGPNSGPRELLLTFDTQRFDDTTELYHVGARYYDPQIGRFLTADTQVPDPMNPKVLHRYAFAGGNPIRYVDPTGHGFWDWFVGIVVVIVIVAAVVIAVVSFGSLSGVSAAMITLAVLGAGLGAGAAGVYALVRGASPLSGSDFWLALAAGAIVGAAIGAGLAATPASLGIGAGFWGGLVADVFVGSVLGGVGTVATHLATGGGPEDMLSAELGWEVLTSTLKGAIFGGVTGWYLNRLAVTTFWTIATGLVSGFLTAEGVWEVVQKPGNPFGSSFSFLNVFGTDANWFSNSPIRRLGIPSWALTGSWVGSGGDPYSRSIAGLLQTMPLAP